MRKTANLWYDMAIVVSCGIATFVVLESLFLVHPWQELVLRITAYTLAIVIPSYRHVFAIRPEYAGGIGKGE